MVERIPAPKGEPEAPLQALIFDSTFNSYRGIEVIFRVYNGEIKKGQRIKFMATDNEYFADEVGTLKLNQVVKKSVKTGDVGYLITGIKTAKEVKGETYYDYYEFQVSGKNLDTLSETAVGCNAEIFFNIRSREYNRKYYTNLAMWKMTYEPSATVDKKSNDEMVSQATAPTTVVSDDDLPF